MKKEPLQNLEIEIGLLLRVGVSIAAAIVFVGGAAYLLRHGHEHVDYRVFRSEPAGLRELRGVVRGGATGSTRAIIQAGLIFLIATPVFRVALSAGVFAKQKDWLYVAFTLVVLGLLGYGLFG